MTEWVMCLTHNCDDLSSEPRHPPEARAVATICNSNASMAGWEAEAGESPKAHKPPSLECTAVKQETLSQSRR